MADFAGTLKIQHKKQTNMKFKTGDVVRYIDHAPLYKRFEKVTHLLTINGIYIVLENWDNCCRIEGKEGCGAYFAEDCFEPVFENIPAKDLDQATELLRV